MEYKLHQATIILPTTVIHTDGTPDIEENFYILRHTSCPAVQAEILFMDNREDVAFLESEEGAAAIVSLHVEGIIRYLSI